MPDMRTRPPSVVARSVLWNELQPVLEWHCPPERTRDGKRFIPEAKPDQSASLQRYAEKARALLAQDGISEQWLNELADGRQGPRVAMLVAQDSLRDLHARLKEAHSVWAAGGEERLAEARARGGPPSRINSESAGNSPNGQALQWSGDSACERTDAPEGSEGAFGQMPLFAGGAL